MQIKVSLMIHSSGEVISIESKTVEDLFKSIRKSLEQMVKETFEALVDGGYIHNYHSVYLDLKGLLYTIIGYEVDRMREHSYSLSRSFDIGKVKSIVIDINEAMDKDFKNEDRVTEAFDSLSKDVDDIFDQLQKHMKR
jgi:hypothetical protein